MKFGKRDKAAKAGGHLEGSSRVFVPGQTPTGYADNDVASDEDAFVASLAVRQPHQADAVSTEKLADASGNESVNELLGEVLVAAKKGHERRHELSEALALPSDLPSDTPGKKVETSSGKSQLHLPDELHVSKRWLFTCLISFGVLFLALSVTVVWLVVNRQGSVSVIKLGSDGTTEDGSSLSDLTNETLFIDGTTQSVGIAAEKPQGLQVASNIGTNARGSTNLRLGILNDAPYLVFENEDGVQWQIGMSGDTLQYGKVGEQQSSFGDLQTAAPAVGIDSSSVLTIQGTQVITPNNLSFDNDTLFIDADNNRVAIGSGDAKGYKLYVSGTLGVSGSVTTTQVSTGGGSAGSPGYTFNGAGNSGIFGGSGNVSITVGGTEVLRAQSGAVIVQNANLVVNGYIQSGGPAWQLKRITGTLNSSGEATVSHGISSGATRIALASAWYQSGGDARQLAVDSYDNSTVTVVGGSPNRAFRLTIIYTADGAGW